MVVTARSPTQDTSGLSHQCSPGSHSVCAVRTQSRVDRKVLSIRKEPICMLSHSKYSTYRGLRGLVVVWLSWLSGRALVAQARGALGSTPGSCWPFIFLSFRLITSKFIYWMVLFNSLTTVGYLLEVFFKLWIPFMVRIFASAWT